MSRGAESPNRRPVDLRRARGETTRSALVEAAIASVALYGLSGTTLTSVAEQAGLSRALVGFHFKTKDHLLAAALSRALQIYDQNAEAAAAGAGPDPREQLAAMLRNDVTFPVRHPAILSLWFAVWGEAKALAIYRTETLPDDRRYRDEVHALVLAIIKDETRARRFATLLTTVVFGLWLEHHLDPAGYDPEDHYAATLAITDAIARSS